MDAADKTILDLLQRDATLALSEIAARVHLSSTACWKRIQKLEAAGVIGKRVALLDAARLNVGVTVFVAIKTNQHNAAWLERFAKVVAAIPEVVEFYRLSGDTDYLMKVLVRDIAAYDAFYKKLIATVPLSDVSSAFAMEQIKSTTALPV